MDPFTVLLCVVFPFLLIWIISVASTRGKNLPPGPAPLPIIGNLLLLGELPHKSLAKLAKAHGPVMRIKLGQVTAMVISSTAAAKEVLQKQDSDFSNRATPDSLHANDHSKHSVAWLPSASKSRIKLRRIMNSYIFSASRLDANQQLRSKKVEDLIGYCRIRCQSGEAVDIRQAAFTVSLNTLSNILFSKDLTQPSADSAKEFKTVMSDFTALAGGPNVVDFFPLLRRFDPQGVRHRMTVQLGKVLDIFHALVRERLESRKPGGATMDVLDSLLGLSEEEPEEIDIDLIERLFLDLLTAGTETTSSTIEWAMAELLKNPQILQKVQAELSEVVGKGKLVEETDVARLPYLQCLVKETFRLHPAAPLLLPRKVDRDVELFGYVVPKESLVLVNAWAIGRDETLWEDPLVFKPERFVQSKQDVRGQDFELIPFGAGRRICPGMSLTLRTVPLVLGSLLNMFDWKLEGDIAPEELDMGEKFHITLHKAQPLRAVPTPL